MQTRLTDKPGPDKPGLELQARTQRLPWHTLSAQQALRAQDVDARHGFSEAEAASWAAPGRFGPNELARAKAEPGWHAFLRQYFDPMQIVLLAAGVLSLYPLRQLGTGLLLIFLTLANAILGLQQEGKAETAVAALQKMMIVTARVRRDGQQAEIPARRLVPGDIVVIAAGDVVPADGRLLQAAMLEVAESELTGESLPVPKGTAPVAEASGAGVPPGRPDPNGVHEHRRHPRHGRVRGHRDRDGDRGRSHLGDAPGAAGGQDPAHTPARSPLEATPGSRGRRANRVDGREPVPWLHLQRGVQRRGRLRRGRGPRAVADRGDDDPRVGYPGAGRRRGHHEAAQLGRNPGIHLGDQHRQDRDAYAEPDDRGRDGRRRPSLRGRGKGLLHRRAHQPDRRTGRDPAGRVPDADGPRLGRGAQRRRAGRRPDRGSPGRAGRQGRHRRGLDQAGVPESRRAPLRRRIQAHGSPGP